MRKLLTAGFIISLLEVIIFPIIGIALIIVSAFIGDPEQQANLISAGTYLIVHGVIAIFGVVVSKIALRRVDANQTSIAIGVLAIISGVVVNVVNIPAGILMIIGVAKGEQKVEEKPAEKAE